MAEIAARINGEYTAVVTAWTDNKRGVCQGKLSAVGPNITDLRLVGPNDKVMPYLRTHNLDEKLGVVNPKKVIVTKGGHTAYDVLLDPNNYIAYTGIRFDGPIEEQPKVVMRHQNAFVPTGKDTPEDVAPAHYNYQTRTNEDPRNLIIVFTPMGYYAQTDRVGFNPLLYNKPNGKGLLEQTWIGVEATDKDVGHADDDRKHKKTKTTNSFVLGVEGSLPRANRLMIMSIPLAQKKREIPKTAWGQSYTPDDDSDLDCMAADDSDEPEPTYRSLAAEGKCKQARLSEGNKCAEVKIKEMTVKHDPGDPVVITVIDYNTVEHDTARTVTVPMKDIEAAIGDMEYHYNLCDRVCKLSTLPAMLTELKEEHLAELKFVPRSDAMAAVHKPDIVSLPHGKGLLFQTDGYIATVDGPFDGKAIRSIVKCDMFQMVPCTVGELAGKFELWINDNGQYEDTINKVATAKLGSQAFGGELYGNVLVVRSGSVP
jgi:hypothetical protein